MLNTWLTVALFTLCWATTNSQTCIFGYFFIALFKTVFGSTCSVLWLVLTIFNVAYLSEEQIRELAEISSQSEDYTDSDPRFHL